MARKARLSAPTRPVWLLSLVLALLGILGYLGFIAALQGYAFWLIVIAFVFLAVASSTRRL